ncbi:MAG: hypothetical protein NVS3B26_07160 [Mycobacteriales bacterium]
MTALEARGVAFVSLTENIDTSTPGGRLVYHLFGALAEFEAALIRERTLPGLSAARARGRAGGRPKVWTSNKLRVAQAMHDGGRHDLTAIARVLSVSRASVYRALAAQHRLGPPDTLHGRRGFLLRCAARLSRDLPIHSERRPWRPLVRTSLSMTTAIRWKM